MGWTEKIIEAGRDSGIEMKRRLDSWANAITGLNTARDKTFHMLPSYAGIMPPQELENLFHNSDIANRIVSAVPEECFREEWKVVERNAMDVDADTNREQAADLASDFKRLGVRTKMKEAQIWGRLYGKGALLIGADDGLSADQPLDIARVRSIDFLTVLDKRDLLPFSAYQNLDEPKYGEIAQYTIQPFGTVAGRPYEPMGSQSPSIIHESRLVLFGGEITGKRERARNQGSDYSILQKCFRALQLVENNWQSASTLLADAGQGVFKIRGLIDMISQQPDVMQARMQLVDLMRSTVRAIVLDAGDGKGGGASEEFTRIATPFNGIPDMLIQTWNRLACAAKMPLIVLMGSKPAGLNSDGEEDLDLWYNGIEAEQRDKILPAVEYLLSICAAARGMQANGVWTVEFGPLRRSSPKDQADIDLKHAQRDKIMVTDTGIWTAEEVALARDADPTGSTTKIDTEARKAMLDASLAATKAEIDQRTKTAKAPLVVQKTNGAVAKPTNES